MSALRFCIRQQLKTYQAGITMPLWPITKLKGIGPVFKTFDEAQQYINKIRPRKS